MAQHHTPHPQKTHYQAIAMGVSFGGLHSLQTILPKLPATFPVPIMAVQHHDPNGDDFLARHLNSLCAVRVKVAEEKETATAGTVYLAPANYHLLVEDDHTLSLSSDEKVNFSRPSIDVLFESCADVYGESLIGVILTGANSDGSKGMQMIKEVGGLSVVQDPQTAEAATMPESAIAATEIDHILPLTEIAAFLLTIVNPAAKNTSKTNTSCDTL